MAWSKKPDPKAPAPPVYHDPTRCMFCGHLQEQHAPEVGCLVPDGPKYIVNEETGEALYVCPCETFVPVPVETSTELPVPETPIAVPEPPPFIVENTKRVKL